MTERWRGIQVEGEPIMRGKRSQRRLRRAMIHAVQLARDVVARELAALKPEDIPGALIELEEEITNGADIVYDKTRSWRRL